MAMSGEFDPWATLFPDDPPRQAYEPYKPPKRAKAVAKAGCTKKANMHPHMPLPGVDYKVRGGSYMKLPADLENYMVVNMAAEGYCPQATITYPLDNYKVPEDVLSFAKLVDVVVFELERGTQVFACCFGGHGRTGLLLGALATVFLIKNGQTRTSATTYVRKNYCKHAVEGPAQERFLIDFKKLYLARNPT